MRTAWWYRTLLWVLSAAVMGGILFFSLQNGTQSGALSSSLSHHLLSLFPFYRNLPALEQQSTCFAVSGVLRAVGHVAEFTLLGVSLSLLWHSYLPRRFWALSLTIGGVFAVVDECVQHFCTVGRAMEFIDLIKDWCGVMLGTLLVYGILCMIRRKKARI